MKSTKSKKKLTKKQLELQESWQKILTYHTNLPSFRQSPLTCTQVVSGRQLPQQVQEIHSLDTRHHDTYLKQNHIYTGSKILGIGTMHKSNAVPIFSEEEAIDISHMRR